MKDTYRAKLLCNILRWMNIPTDDNIKILYRDGKILTIPCGQLLFNITQETHKFIMQMLEPIYKNNKYQLHLNIHSKYHQYIIEYFTSYDHRLNSLGLDESTKNDIIETFNSLGIHNIFDFNRVTESLIVHDKPFKAQCIIL